jgi:signal transduction histidine kinase
MNVRVFPHPALPCGVEMTSREGLRNLLTRAAKWGRDWRVRVLVPVLLINIVAFGGLYWLMYRYALENLVNTNKFGATMLLDEIELDLRDLQVAHNRSLLQARLVTHSQGRDLLALNVYSPDARAIGFTHGEPGERERAQVQVVRLAPTHPTMWLTEGTAASTLYGVRALRNGPSCMQCHGQATQFLGAIQLGVDLTAPMAEAKTRVGRNFAMAGLAWTTLLGLMFWTGGVVIGRPLAKLEKSIPASGALNASRHDLEAFATRVNGTIWELIENQRQRDETMKQRMVRAEQLASLGELAAGLTHEIKNPLAGLSATIELLRDDDPGPYREVYGQMLTELKRVSTTVDSLLRLAKPQPPQRADVDMVKVLRDVEALFAARTRRMGLTLDIEIPDEFVPVLKLDHGLMVQLLVNLLTNSIQATDRGGTIRVLLAPFPNRDGVVLAVSDTGKGIPGDALQRVFDPFFTTKDEGTGLGLAICRQIVEQHGGTITIESEVERGTQVVMLLPDLRGRQEAGHGEAAAG